jgi:hypothetical protein
LPSNSLLEAPQRFELEARLGSANPDLVHDTCLPEVVVHSVGPFSYPASKTLNPLDRKRLNVWHNASRNVAVARIATACVAGNQADLREYGWHEWQRGETCVNDTDEEQQHVTPSSVVVVVESCEHARIIKKLLPDWPILDSRDGEGADKAITPLCIATISFPVWRQLEFPVGGKV